MSGAAWAAIGVGAVSVISNLLIQAYYYGRLTERVDGLGHRIKLVEDEQVLQRGHISTLREHMGEVKGKLGLSKAE